MEVERLPDGRALSALSLAELREACGSRGLSKGGSRKDLADRLKIRLELEKLREESTRKAKAKEDVVPNIALQDTAVGQSDVVRQYLEAQQRRLELFAQHGQMGDQQQQQQQPTFAATATTTATEQSTGVVKPTASAHYNHTPALSCYENKASKCVVPSTPSDLAKDKGITTRQGKSSVAVVRGTSPTVSLGRAPTATGDAFTGSGDAAAPATKPLGAKSVKATRSRAGNNNIANVMQPSTPPSTTKKTRVGSTPPSAPPPPAVSIPASVQEDQLVPLLPALLTTTTKRRRGAVQPPVSTISRAEQPVTAVKSSPRATKGGQNESRGPTPQPLAEAVTVPEIAREVKRGRGRPRKHVDVVPPATALVFSPPALSAFVPPVDTVVTECVGPAAKLSSGPAGGGNNSSLRERGKDKERSPPEEVKAQKLLKINQTSHDDRTSRGTTLGGATITPIKSIKTKPDKISLSESVKAIKDKPLDGVKSSKEFVTNKRLERTSNRSDNQTESRETKEVRTTRGKRPRSQDDATAAAASTGEPNKKLNKSNRHKEKIASKFEVTPDKTEPTEKAMAVHESRSVEDPIEAALLALHGGCDDPSVLSPPRASSHEAHAPATPTLSQKSAKSRSGAHREARNRVPSTDRTTSETKTPVENASETPVSKAPVSPGIAPPGTIDKKTSPSTSKEATSPKDDSWPQEDNESSSKLSASRVSPSPVKAASASPPSDRSETRRSDRNQRETRKRSKVENIVQRLARRENRYSNPTPPTTEDAQTVDLREPIVLLERTELPAEHVPEATMTSPMTSKTLKPKPEPEIKTAAKEAESRLQSSREKDEKSSDTQRLPTPPRPKRPRRE
ncbi:apoptotic chromatin condensation inducer in the nucleus isoform X1, partial [Tropilaelaps mercedesae]